jgi:hypothetical protein
MITRTITFFSQIDMKEALDLPPKYDSYWMYYNTFKLYK